MEEICSADLDTVCTVHFVDFVIFVQQLDNTFYKLSVSYDTATCFYICTSSLGSFIIVMYSKVTS